MAPIPRGDLDMDNPSSDVGDSQDQDSPMRRQFSEPFRPQSTSTQISQSPEPLARKLKCDWCGKLLEYPKDPSITEEDVLESHIASHHPNSDSFGYDGVEDDVDVDADELELDEETMNDAAQFEETEEAYQGEEAEDMEGVDEVEEAEEAEEGDLAEMVEAEEGEAGGDDQNLEEPETAVASEANGDQSEEIDTSKPSSITNLQVAPQAHGKLDQLEWLSNPRTAFPEDYRRRVATWQASDIKDRLPKVWTVHKAANFSPNYDQEMAKIEGTWQHVFGDKPKKKDASQPIARPSPYKASETTKGEFLELASFDDLIEMLRKPDSLSPDELYAATEAAAVAMKVWQDEYIALDKLYTRTHRHYRAPLSNDAKREQFAGHKKRTGQPLARVPEHGRDFEDKKEAMLYGYKHNVFTPNTSTAVSWVPQNPFVQGGFVPTPAQARKMASKVAPEDRNPDGWTPILRDGLELVPKLWEPRREPVLKFTRKRKAVETEPSKTDTEETQNESDNNGEETEDENHPAKRRTRGRGGRRATFEPYQPSENVPTSTPRGRGGGRARGRGRGRGIGRITSSRNSLEAPQPITFTPTASRGRGRRGASTIAYTPKPRLVEETPVSQPEYSPMPEASPPLKATPAPRRDATAEEMEEARRQKIANSKNPKRTKAMLDHWERFNREGRIRNPKRSKAQIESDRVADESKPEEPRSAGRRRKSPSLAPIPTGNLAPKAPAVAPMPGHLGHGPTLPSLGMHQYPPPNPYAHPQAVPQPPQQMPHYAAFPYIQYGMGHLPGPPPGPHDHHRRV